MTQQECERPLTVLEKQWMDGIMAELYLERKQGIRVSQTEHKISIHSYNELIAERPRLKLIQGGKE